MQDKPTTILKERLEAERIQVQAELARLRGILKNRLDPDAEEAASELTEINTVLSIIHEERRKLQDIEHALQQVQEGVYGVCERCGQPIDPERLEAVPESTYCFNCKVIVERLERTMAKH